MKKILLLGLALMTLVGCGNKNRFGFGNYTYNFITCKEDYINIKNERVQSWKDYDGEQIEITLEDGNNLLVSSYACFLSKEKVGK